MKRTRVLVVDDEAALRKFVTSVLGAAGYDAMASTDGEAALEVVRAEPLDLVVLDLMLPGIDGLEVCRRLRDEGDIPIIVLSAKGEEVDKVDALNSGADDYLTKPFGVSELLARVQAVLRRTQGRTRDSGARVLVKGAFELDSEARQFRIDTREVSLTRTEFDLLYYLVEHSGKVVPHSRLLTEVWGLEYRSQTEYLHVYVRRLRHKIEPDPANPRHLVTLPGLGYTFRPEPSST
jgi:two-component system KDP operon response regulator KdpE